MRNVLLGLICTAMILLLAGCHALKKERLAEQLDRFDEISRSGMYSDRPYPEFMGLIVRQYGRVKRAMDGLPLSNLSDTDLHDLFEAASDATLYTSGSEYALDARDIIHESERRGIDVNDRRKSLVDLLISARLFDDAEREISKSHERPRSQYPDFSEVLGQQPPRSLLGVSDDGQRLISRGVLTRRGPLVVVVSSPWCHFSNNARDAIDRDATLSRMMNLHSVWVLPQSPIHDFAVLHEWNMRHAESPINIINSSADWPEITGWGTPGFYFYFDNELVWSFSGWPKEGHFQQLREGLQRIGVEAGSATSPERATTDMSRRAQQATKEEPPRQ